MADDAPSKNGKTDPAPVDTRKTAPAVKSETDQQRAARHKKEQQALTATHLENIKEEHKKNPLPFKVKFSELSHQDMTRHRERRKGIDQANTAYRRMMVDLLARQRRENEDALKATRAWIEKASAPTEEAA